MAFKIIHIILLASVKYFYTLPYALVIGLEYEQAILAVLIGGIGGFLFFYYLSKPLIRAFNAAWPCICDWVPQFIKLRYRNFCNHNKVNRKIKIFTRKNRFLARFRQTYGFWGLIISTPILLSIPLGAFLVGKYYSHRSHLVLYMVISIIGWGAVLSGIVHLFPNVFLK